MINLRQGCRRSHSNYGYDGRIGSHVKRIILSLFLVCFGANPLLSAAMPPAEKLPIVYHPNYDISLGWAVDWIASWLHPFDTHKYSKTYNYLVKNVGVKENQFHTPKMATQEDLLLVHTQEYLDSLNNPSNVAVIAEVGPLRFLANWIIQSCILDPMKYGTGGTILGCELALKHGWAINLSGGYHHAKPNNGEGFCFFNDIAIAIYKLRQKLKQENPDFNESQFKILIVDLDAHQGNGHEIIFLRDPNVFILDIYNQWKYPRDLAAKRGINFDCPVDSGIGDDEYLGRLREILPRAIKESKPNLIIYNAGTDILKGDNVGSMGVSAQGIITRDEFVFRTARKNGIPTLMILSGGYTPQSAEIISHSIENLLTNVIGASFEKPVEAAPDGSCCSSEPSKRKKADSQQPPSSRKKKVRK